jgi:hypothetical protein
VPENAPYYKKFTVIDNRTGEEVEERTFTLKIDSDPFAGPALLAYRDAAEVEGGYEQVVAAIDEILEELA